MPSYLSYKRHMACLDADDDIIGWFTTKNGVHVPIRKGQTKETATKEFFESKPRVFTVNQMVPWYASPESKPFSEKRRKNEQEYFGLIKSPEYNKAEKESYELRDKYDAPIKPKDYDKLIEAENKKRDWEEQNPVLKDFFNKSSQNLTKAREEVDKKYNGILKKARELRHKDYELKTESENAEEEYYNREDERVRKEVAEKFPNSSDKFYKFENGTEMFKSPSVSYETGNISAIGLMGRPSDRVDIESFGSGNIIEMNRDQAMSEWAKTAKPQETFGGISEREERVLQLYSHFTPENTALREGKESPHNTAVIKNIINRTYNGSSETVYRGVPGIESISSLKPGDIYTDKAFMSTSPDKNIAGRFGGTNKYILKIKTATGFGKGIDIGWASEKPEESEFLLQAGSQFKVLRVDHKKREIDLEQL